MHRYDLGVVAISLCGFFLLYKSISLASFFFMQVVHGPIGAFGLFVTLGPLLASLGIGFSLIFGRYSLAASLFGRPPRAERSDESSYLTLENVVTLVGLFYFVSGFLYLAYLSADWIVGNVEPGPDPDPSTVWPYRVSAVAELVIGYVFTFHAPAIARWLGSQQRSRHAPRG